MATSPMPVAEPQASISSFGRIVGIFFSPKSTFADIVKKPSWIAPVVVLLLAGLLINGALIRNVNWTEASKEQIAKSKLVYTNPGGARLPNRL